MFFLVKVKVRIPTIQAFAQALQAGSLDNSRVRGDTWCLSERPEIGYSVWEATDANDFETRFAPWREYYEEVEVQDVISPKEAMAALFSQLGG